jgi:hypothetical protein
MKGRFAMWLEKDEAGYISYEVKGRELPYPIVSFSLEGYSPCDKEDCVKKHIRAIISAPARLPKDVRAVVESLYGHLMALYKEFRLDSYSIGGVIVLEKDLEEEPVLALRIALTHYEGSCYEDEECRPPRWEAEISSMYEGFEEIHKLKAEVVVGRGKFGIPAKVDAELLRRAVMSTARQIYNAYAYAAREGP